jgi:adenine-specific DNA-methyltransferase
VPPRVWPSSVGSVGQDGGVAVEPGWAPDDTQEQRKARGAFFTPPAITRHIAQWALRDRRDRVLEPSAGDAAFLVEAVHRLRDLGADVPLVEGIEIHEHSAGVARERARAAGGLGEIRTSDFFLVGPEPRFDAVIGNPPFVRYQEWTGVARSRSREAALNAGVALTGLASSWAAFTVHAALFLRDGGRLGLVLPAELLSVNYAAPVRKFLFDHFRSIELVLFEKQVFEEVEADTLLLMAEGFNEGPTDHAIVRQMRRAEDLSTWVQGTTWTPDDPSAKWINTVGGVEATELLTGRAASGDLVDLEAWGDTTLGMVTGNNRYFALSPARVTELGLKRTDLIRLSPPGSSHLRGLALTSHKLTDLGQRGQATWLLRPAGDPSREAQEYIAAGETAGVHEAYKCRVRGVWWRVPMVRPADLLLTYMNADAARLVTNEAGAHHLNSVHGVYLRDDMRELGRKLLPIAALNSATLLSAETVGRSYGGGVLKIEPREADRWLMPSPELLGSRADSLLALKPTVALLLRTGHLRKASELVDQALLGGIVSSHELDLIREAHFTRQARRFTRGKRG